MEIDLKRSDQILELFYYVGSTEDKVESAEQIDQLIENETNDPRVVYVLYHVPGKKELKVGHWYCLVADGARNVLVDYFKKTGFESKHFDNEVHRHGYDALKKYMMNSKGLEQLETYVSDQLDDLLYRRFKDPISRLELDFDKFFADDGAN